MNSTIEIRTKDDEQLSVSGRRIDDSTFAITPSMSSEGPVEGRHNLTHIGSGMHLASSKKPRTLAKLARELWSMINTDAVIREYWESFKGGFMPRDMTPEGMRERIREFERNGK